jgi:hypothetical protein
LQYMTILLIHYRFSLRCELVPRTAIMFQFASIMLDTKFHLVVFCRELGLDLVRQVLEHLYGSQAIVFAIQADDV